MRTLTNSELDAVSGGATLTLALGSANALGAATGNGANTQSTNAQTNTTSGGAGSSIALGTSLPSLNAGFGTTVVLTG